MTAAFDETAARPGRERGFRRPARSAEAAGNVHAGHGGRRLATGIAVAAGFLVIGHLVHAVMQAPVFPPGAGPWPAWILLATLGIAATIAVIACGFTVPTWLLAGALVGLAAVVALDVSATTGLLHLGITPTAGAAAAVALLPVAAMRLTRVPLIAACAAAAVLVAEAVWQPEAGRAIALGLAVAASAALPMVLGVIAIDGFRRLVRREVDLSLVQSTVATPRSAVGMRASEELVNLDRDAEDLLEDVGSGRVAIPLPPEASELAGALAARLRVRLIEGRTDTWLRHAVTESAYLSGHVTVDDPTGLAAQLTPAQREGLLLVLWMLVGSRPRRATARALVRISADDDDDELRPEQLRVAVSVSDVQPRHLDPAIWDAVGTVGAHRTFATADGFGIEIDGRLEPHHRAPTAPSPGARHRGA
ncbi:hypothetical protein FLP10_02865 [Agromyces intestinalis]|uniref:Uncharacterized protein n=1 Tax=Agromyces intestinalis TaxID=2592652 RepID=A0A5C1YBS8_9MICO|nr:hypothetical protein [Agromyces intestinalis]QEO13471.1 hypothetical protein FLP10_02865 [Agromyces intestinalis]